MSPDALESVFSTLDEADVRYVVVGGLAIALHGYLRFSATLDLMVPEATNVRHSAGQALARIEYQVLHQTVVSDESSTIPGSIGRYAGEVVGFRSNSEPYPPINLVYIDSPDFEFECGMARKGKSRKGRSIPFLALDSLIAGKVVVETRPDADDLEHLRWIAVDLNRQTQGSIDPWEAATWEGSRRVQLRRWAGLSLEEIVDAQNQMHSLSEMLASSPSLRESRGFSGDERSG